MQVYLTKPTYGMLRKRQAMLLDKETMSYNIGYDEGIVDSCIHDGTISFPECNWNSWFDNWVESPKQRCYRYIMRKEDDVFLGEVSCHYDESTDHYLMGIIILDPYRRKGYAKEALSLFVTLAFEELKIPELSNFIPKERKCAILLFQSVGFVIQEETQQGVWLCIKNKDKY